MRLSSPRRARCSGGVDGSTSARVARTPAAVCSRSLRVFSRFGDCGAASVPMPACRVSCVLQARRPSHCGAHRYAWLVLLPALRPVCCACSHVRRGDRCVSPWFFARRWSWRCTPRWHRAVAPLPLQLCLHELFRFSAVVCVVTCVVVSRSRACLLRLRQVRSRRCRPRSRGRRWPAPPLISMVAGRRQRRRPLACTTPRRSFRSRRRCTQEGCTQEGWVPCRCVVPSSQGRRRVCERGVVHAMDADVLGGASSGVWPPDVPADARATTAAPARARARARARGGTRGASCTAVSVRH